MDILLHQGNPFIFLLCAVLAVVFILKTVQVCLSLVFGQISNLFQLYFCWERETLEAFHPYTRAILQNRCPELRQIANLRKLPQTRDVKRKIRDTIQSVINTLEENEQEPIKDEIIAALKAA